MMLIVFLVLFLAIIFLRYRFFAKIFLATALLFILAIGSGAVPALLLEQLESSYTPHITPQFDKNNIFVLLGAGEIKPKFSNLILPSSFAYSRIFETARLYSLCKKAHRHCTILISGGDTIGRSISEAEVYQKSMLQFGIAAQDILLETKSMNTYENAKFSRALINEKENNKIFLITSAIHLKRSLLYFSHFGITAQPAASEIIVSHPSYIPMSYNFTITDFAIHECIGILRFYIYEWMGWNQ